jgi:glycosyltransferase involved in cell wall biosynthesis
MDTEENNQNDNRRIIVGVNTAPLSSDGGGMKQHFIDTFTNIIKLAPWDKYKFVIFYFHKAYKVIFEIEGIEAEINNGNIKLIQLEKIEQIWDYRDQFNFYLCPLNNFNPKLTDKPSIGILADIQEHYYPQFFSRGELMARFDVYPDIIASSFTAVTISEFSKKTFVDKFHTNSDKIKVIYPSISHKFKKNVAKRQDIDFKLPEKYLLYPANSYPHKNHVNLIKAFEILKRQGHTDMKVVLTGDTKYGGNDISKTIRKAGVEDLVIDLGYVERGVIDEIFRNAAGLIYPSLFEGFGIPVIEMLYMNKPALCSDDPCIREVAGDSVYYFDETSPESIAQCVLSFSEEKFKDLSVERMEVNQKFDSDINARDMLSTISSTYKDFNKSKIPKDQIIDISIISEPYNLVRINKTIDSIKRVGVKGEIKILNKIEKLQRTNLHLILFAGQEINNNIWNCDCNVIYSPIIKEGGVPKYIVAEDMWERFIKPSKLLKEQYIHDGHDSKIKFDPSKSFIEFSIEDYYDYEKDSFTMMLLFGKGLSYKFYSYFRKRKKLFLLPILRFAFNLLHIK